MIPPEGSLDGQARDIPNPARRFGILAGAVLLVLCLAAYHPLTGHYFRRDDFNWLAIAQEWERGPQGMSAVLKGEYGVTTTFNVVFAALYRLGGTDNPAPYYWWMILSHWLASVAALALGARLVGWRAALVGAALFAVYWGNHQAVTWVAVGYRPMCAALFTTAVMLWIAHHYEGGWWRPPVAGLLGALALFAKEDATPLLAVVVVAHAVLPAGRSAPRRGPLPYLPLVVIYILYAVAQPYVRTFRPDSPMLGPGYLIGLHGARNLVDCVPQMLFPDFSRGGFRELAAGILPPGLVGVVAASSVGLRIAFNLGALWLLIRRPGVVRFLVAWIYITFLPFVFFVYEWAVSARYRYLPAVGLCLLIGYGIMALHRRLDGRRCLQTALWAVVMVAIVANVAMLRHIQGDLGREGELRRAVVEEFARHKPTVLPGTVFRFEGLPKGVQDAVKAVRMLYDVPTRGLRPGDTGEADVVVRFEGARIVDITRRTSRSRRAPP